MASRSVRRSVSSIVTLGCAAALLMTAEFAAAGEPKRYGIEGQFLSYDEERQVFKVRVLSRVAAGLGGSTVGGEAPKDVKPSEVMEFAVKSEGSVLSRTVIKSSNGTGLDKTGTREGFRQATLAIPKDRSVALSITDNLAAKTDAAAPRFRLMTVVIRMSQSDIQRLLEAFEKDEE